METITLYRVIGWEELSVLLSEGKVKGRFETEMKQNTYRKSYGKVVCTFTEPRHFLFAEESAAFVKITVPLDRVVEEGQGTYRLHGYNNSLRSITLREVFISHYLLSEVEIKGYPNLGKTMLEELNSSHFGWIIEGVVGGYSYDEIKEHCGIYIDCDKLIPIFQRLYPHMGFLKDCPMITTYLGLFENKGSDVIDYQLYTDVRKKDLHKFGYEDNNQYVF